MRPADGGSGGRQGCRSTAGGTRRSRSTSSSRCARARAGVAERGNRRWWSGQDGRQGADRVREWRATGNQGGGGWSLALVTLRLPALVPHFPSCPPALVLSESRQPWRAGRGGAGGGWRRCPSRGECVVRKTKQRPRESRRGPLRFKPGAVSGSADPATKAEMPSHLEAVLQGLAQRDWAG